MDQAWLDARIHGWSKRPIVEMLITSTLDDSLAPPGGTPRACSVSTRRLRSPTVHPGTIAKTKPPTR
jgi:phytoene dehydrogenase-like protein